MSVHMFKLQVTEHKLQVTEHTSYKLQHTSYKLQYISYKLHVQYTDMLQNTTLIFYQSINFEMHVNNGTIC